MWQKCKHDEYKHSEMTFLTSEMANTFFAVGVDHTAWGSVKIYWDYIHVPYISLVNEALQDHSQVNAVQFAIKVSIKLEALVWLMCYAKGKMCNLWYR